MGKIRRADPCACGSGKVASDCCGYQNVISLYHFLQKDIEEIEQLLIAYTMNEFEFPFSQCMEEALMTIDVPEGSEVLEVVTLFVANWFIFSRPVLGGESVMDMFVDTFSHQVKRPLLRRSLPKWKEARLNIYRIEEMLNRSQFVVRPLFGGEQMKVNIFDEDDEIEEGYLLLGVLVPIGDDYTFFTTYLDNQPKDEEKLVTTLGQLMDDYGETKFSNFIDVYFPEVLDAFLFDDSSVVAQEMKGLSDEQTFVADQFQSVMEETGMHRSFIDLGIVLWYSFCKKRNPDIHNPMLYVAILHYVVEKAAFGGDDQLKKLLVEEYGVSQYRLCEAYTEFKQVLQPELQELDGIMENM